MENDVGVFELVEFIFQKKVTIVEEVVPRCENIPDCLESKDFLDRLTNVLRYRKEVIYCKLEQYLNANIHKVLSSHEMYLRYVMFVCLFEHEKYQNVFESFLNVCCIVKVFSKETLKNIGVDLSDLNPDIVMVFYDRVLKNNFCIHGGFHRLVEFIHGNKYNSWNLPENRDSSGQFNCVKLVGEFVSEIKGFDFKEVANPMNVAKEAPGKSLADKVLSTTSVQLPDLPSESDLIKKLIAFRTKEKKKNAGAFRWLNSFSHGISSEEIGNSEIKSIIYTRKCKLEKKKLAQNTAKEATETAEKPEALTVIVQRGSLLSSEPSTNYDSKQQNSSLKTAEIKDSEETLECCPSLNSDSVADDGCVEQMIDNARYEKIIEAVIRHNHSITTSHENSNNSIREKADGILSHLNGNIKSLMEVLNEHKE